MIKNIPSIGAAVFAAAVLLPTDAGARGLAGHFFYHGFHGVRHHFQGGRHHFHDVRDHAFWPFAGVVGTYAPYADTVPVAESAAPVESAPSPRCTHSRETVTVPAENGGERQITITRC